MFSYDLYIAAYIYVLNLFITANCLLRFYERVSKVQIPLKLRLYVKLRLDVKLLKLCKDVLDVN